MLARTRARSLEHTRKERGGLNELNPEPKWEDVPLLGNRGDLSDALHSCLC